MRGEVQIGSEKDKSHILIDKSLHARSIFHLALQRHAQISVPQIHQPLVLVLSGEIRIGVVLWKG